jgi:hypothetical protein
VSLLVVVLVLLLLRGAAATRCCIARVSSYSYCLCDDANGEPALCCAVLDCTCWLHSLLHRVYAALSCNL